jgi:hypothetical protein
MICIIDAWRWVWHICGMLLSTNPVFASLNTTDASSSDPPPCNAHPHLLRHHRRFPGCRQSGPLSDLRRVARMEIRQWYTTSGMGCLAWSSTVRVLWTAPMVANGSMSVSKRTCVAAGVCAEGPLGGEIQHKGWASLLLERGLTAAAGIEDTHGELSVLPLRRCNNFLHAS